MKKLMMFFGVLLLMGLVSAAPRTIDAQYTDVREGWTLADQISLAVSQMFRPMTIINGAQCSVYPDDIRMDYTGKVTCPTSVSNWFGLNQIKGCAVVVYSGDGHNPEEKHLNPGESISLTMQSYENYYCTDTSCLCTSFEDGGCGADGCDSHTMLRVRDCPNNCGEEELCVYRTTCGHTTTTTTKGVTTTTKGGLIPPIKTDLLPYVGIGLIVIALIVMFRRD